LTFTDSSLVGDLKCAEQSANSTENATDNLNCGGVVAASALARWAINSNMNGSSSSSAGDVLPEFTSNLELYFIDQRSLFVNMHPLSWDVNVPILKNLLQAPVAMIRQTLLIQDKRDFTVSTTRDLSGLQRSDWPLLIANVNIPPSISWYPYYKAIYFDPDTRLAIMVLRFRRYLATH
jgi:hypothetical protein